MRRQFSSRSRKPFASGSPRRNYLGLQPVQEKTPVQESSTPSEQFWQYAPKVTRKGQYNQAHLVLYAITKGWTLKSTAVDKYELECPTHSSYSLEDFKDALAATTEVVPVGTFKVSPTPLTAKRRTFEVEIPGGFSGTFPPLLGFIFELLNYYKEAAGAAKRAEHLLKYVKNDIYGKQIDFSAVDATDTGILGKNTSSVLAVSSQCIQTSNVCVLHVAVVGEDTVVPNAQKAGGANPPAITYTALRLGEEFLPRLAYLKTGLKMEWDKKEQCFHITL